MKALTARCAGVTAALVLTVSRDQNPKVPGGTNWSHSLMTSVGHKLQFFSPVVVNWRGGGGGSA